MRKLLMASAAILGATSTLALAQAPAAPANPTQGQYSGPYGAGPAANNNNNAWGVANTPTGSAAAGGLSGSIYSPNVDAVPAPGTVTIRINGRVEVDVAASYTSADRGIGANAGYKTNPVAIGSYMRIYPGFDGMAANGLRYGAAIELRENFGPADRPFGASAAGGAANSPSGNDSGQTVFVRRAFTYLASDKAGLLRFGQTDGVLGLFDNCIFTTQCWDAGIGNFNGGANQGFGPTGPLAVPFVWFAQAGAEYDPNKIVYLSPQYFGFDFGVDYSPNMGNGDQVGGLGVANSQAGSQLITVTSGNDPTRWYNKVSVGLRWQQAFGAVDAKAYGYYSTAAKENLTTAAGTTVGGTYASGIAGRPIRYDNLNFYKFGAAVTTFSTTFAVDYIGGAVNNQLGNKPTGAPNMNAILGGVTYANGPLVLGAEVGVIDHQGAAALTGVSQRHELEAAFGGSYKVAPGLQLVGEYMYMQRHQGGFNFATGAVGGTGDAHGQSLVFATVLTW